MESWMLPGGFGKTNFGQSDGEGEMGQSFNLDPSVFNTSQSVSENPSFAESSFIGVQEAFSESMLRELLENNIKNQGGNSNPPHLINASSTDKEYSSKKSSSTVDRDAHYSSLTDLKLGRLSAWRGAGNYMASEVKRDFSQQELPRNVKRARLACLNGQVPLCQVHGCNMDLGSFKDYYKRHRVCQAHSKTAKVIVNGIQQRFCQQCSRFHLLSEFDNGKRSCRKRLAGHNERRRKPPIHFQLGKNRTILPYDGNNFSRATLSQKAHHFYQDTFPHYRTYEYTSWSKHVGLGGTFASGEMQTSALEESAKSSITSNCLQKEISFTNWNSSVPGSDLNCYTSRRVLGTSTSFPSFDSGVANSSRARSLLSSQPAGFQIHPLTTPLLQPSIFHDEDAVKSKSSFLEMSELPLQASANITCLSEIDPSSFTQIDCVPCELKSGAHDLGSQMQKNFHDPLFDGNVCTLSRERDHTINLFGLSSLIQDAESHLRSVQVKQELNRLLPIT